jgi:diaminopimelate epimerase
MNYQFTKMHGLGNDFVVFDAINQSLHLTPEQVRHVCDRHRGVGCDQLLLVEKPQDPDADFRYRIFNSDGGEVEQCGNGARCFVRFVHDRQLTDKKEIVVETNTGIIIITLMDDNRVTVNMGKPVFEPAAIPFQGAQRADHYSLELNTPDGKKSVSIGAVSMGNPHAVLQVDSVATAAVDVTGPLIEKHERFPQRVNVGFMEIVNRQRIRLRVYERGVGETIACGTGACAAAVMGIQWGLLDEEVTVQLPGGELTIRWQGEPEPVWMTGPAESVYEGTIEL